MTLDMDDGYLTDDDITVALTDAGVKGGKMTFEQFCEVFETVIEEGGDDEEDEDEEDDEDDDDDYEIDEGDDSGEDWYVDPEGDEGFAENSESNLFFAQLADEEKQKAMMKEEEERDADNDGDDSYEQDLKDAFDELKG